MCIYIYNIYIIIHISIHMLYIVYASIYYSMYSAYIKVSKDRQTCENSSYHLLLSDLGYYA